MSEELNGIENPTDKGGAREGLRERLRRLRKKIEDDRVKRGKRLRKRREFERPRPIELYEPPSDDDLVQGWVAVVERVELSELSNEPLVHISSNPRLAFVDTPRQLDFVVEQYLYSYRGMGLQSAKAFDPVGGYRFTDMEVGPQSTAVFRLRGKLAETGLEYQNVLAAHYEQLDTYNKSRAPQLNQVSGKLFNGGALEAIVRKKELFQTDGLNSLPLEVALVADADAIPYLETYWGLFEQFQSNANRGNFKWLLTSALEEGRLPLSVAKDRLGVTVRDGEVYSASGVSLTSLSYLPAEHECDPSGIVRRPSCFGCPGVEQSENSICRRCMFAERCAVSAERAKAILLERHGSVDPMREHRKRIDRERQRRCREKKRASTGR